MAFLYVPLCLVRLEEQQRELKKQRREEVQQQAKISKVASSPALIGSHPPASPAPSPSPYQPQRFPYIIKQAPAHLLHQPATSVLGIPPPGGPPLSFQPTFRATPLMPNVSGVPGLPGVSGVPGGQSPKAVDLLMQHLKSATSRATTGPITHYEATGAPLAIAATQPTIVGSDTPAQGAQGRLARLMPGQQRSWHSVALQSSPLTLPFPIQPVRVPIALLAQQGRILPGASIQGSSLASCAGNISTTGNSSGTLFASSPGHLSLSSPSPSASTFIAQSIPPVGSETTLPATQPAAVSMLGDHHAEQTSVELQTGCVGDG